MKKFAFAGLLLSTSLLPDIGLAAVVLSGKTNSQVSAHITKPDNLIITDDIGGWFEQGLELVQQGGWDTPFQVEARLRVLSSTGVFQVRLGELPRIQHSINPQLTFRSPMVKFGNEESAANRPLQVGHGVEFLNPVAAQPGDDSVGYYNLFVSALPPEGDFKSTTGNYSGVLSLIFEPVVRTP